MLDAVVRYGVHQVAQGDPRLHFALEPHQHRFGHIQWHNTGGSGEGHQARACREGNAHGETGVGIATGTDRVGQQHTIQPGVNNPIARAQGNPTASHDEVWQGVLRVDVNGFGIGCGMTERLHGQVGRKSQAGQVLQFVTRHGTGGILGAHGGHTRLTVGAGADAVGAAGLAYHFLSQGEALAGIHRLLGLAEQVGCAQPQCLPRAHGQAAADNQVDTTTGTYFVQQDVGFQFEFA